MSSKTFWHKTYRMHGVSSNIVTPYLILGEEVFLNKVVSDLTSSEVKFIYADWLDEQGDEVRANFLRQFCAVLDHPPTPEGLSDFDLVPPIWRRMIGGDIAHHWNQFTASLSFEFQHSAIDLLSASRPALSISILDSEGALPAFEFPNDKHFAIGKTKRFGLPDLPVGMRWPEARDLDDNSTSNQKCGFLAQVNFAEFSETRVGPFLPSEGLLSVFSFYSGDKNTDVLYHTYFFPSIELLERKTAPEDFDEPDNENFLRDAAAIQFVETLDIPPFSPFAHPQFVNQSMDQSSQESIADEILRIRMVELGVSESLLGFARTDSYRTSDSSTPNRRCNLIRLDGTELSMPVGSLLKADFSEVESIGLF